MARPIRVDNSRPATVRDTARTLGVSKRRTDELVEQVRQMIYRDAKTGQIVIRAKKSGNVVGNGVRNIAPAMPARKPTRRRHGAPKPRVDAGSVFLNIPYDADFENLFLAYISAICAFGFTPRATLGEL